MKPASAAACALLLLGCPTKNEAPVCGLHSAAAPVVIQVGKKERTLAVGAKLKPSDHLTSGGDALLECFGGADRKSVV